MTMVRECRTFISPLYEARKEFLKEFRLRPKDEQNAMSRSASESADEEARQVMCEGGYARNAQHILEDDICRRLSREYEALPTAEKGIVLASAEEIMQRVNEGWPKEHQLPLHMAIAQAMCTARRAPSEQQATNQTGKQ